MREKDLQTELTKTGLYEELSSALNYQFQEQTRDLSILDWVQKVQLGAGPFEIEGHEYEIPILQDEAPRYVYKKGAQMGFSEVNILKSMHGLDFWALSSRGPLSFPDR